MTLIHTSDDNVIPELIDRKIILAIGVFDGVHVGHRCLIKRAQKLARKFSAECVIYTFWPYPIHNYDNEEKKIIYSREHKYKVLSDLGIKYIVEQSFDAQFSTISADKFVPLLKRKFPYLFGICVGTDFKFGYARTGDIKSLKAKCCNLNISCECVEQCHIDGQRVSSTRIRELVEIYKLKEADKLLGVKFFHHLNR